MFYVYEIKLHIFRSIQGDLHLPGHDTDQRQCAMEWPTTV
jgi:hypothetical protein